MQHVPKTVKYASWAVESKKTSETIRDRKKCAERGRSETRNRLEGMRVMPDRECHHATDNCSVSQVGMVH